MITAKALADNFRQPLDEGWGYIWGTRGQTWTQASQDKATRAMTVKHGSKWIGKRVADCSGMFVWAYKLHSMSIYHGSNTIYNKYCTETGPLAGEVKIRRGTAVFQNTDGKRGHIGLYIGGGMCIEAKGTPHGVVSSPLAVWDEWGTLSDVDYTGEVWENFGIVPLDTITKGAKGELVKYLQRALVEDGYEVGKIDGIFGSDTLSAVRAFQHDHGLTPDGKVGKKTWAAIKALVDDDEDGEDKPAEVPLPQSPAGDSSLGEGANTPQEPAEESSTTVPTLTLEELTKRLIALEGIVYGGDDFRLPEGGDTNG